MDALLFAWDPFLVDGVYTYIYIYIRTELISKCRHENKFYLANFELNCQQ